MSLRHRLVAALLVIGVVLIGAGVAVAGLIRGALIDQVDAQLERTGPPLGTFIGASSRAHSVGASARTPTIGSPSSMSRSRPVKGCACSARPSAPSLPPI